MRTHITNYIRAGYPALYLVSCEEARVEAELMYWFSVNVTFPAGG